MSKKNNLEKIEKIVQEFFEKTGFETKTEIKDLSEKALLVDLKTEEPQILIGEKGETLFYVQHLLRKALQKQTKEQLFVDLDINEYKKKKNEYLKILAKEAADEVIKTKKEKELSPMTAQERRIIHLELAEKEGVVTESAGQEPERRIKIIPNF